MRSDLNIACFQPVWSETHRGTCKDSSPSGRRRRDGREGGTGERLEWRGKFALQATFARWIYLDQELLFYPSVWEKWPPSHHDHLLVNVLWCRLKPGSLFDCGYEIWRWKHVGLCCSAARPPAPPPAFVLFFAGILVFQEMITDLDPDSPSTFLETPPSEARKDAKNFHKRVWLSQGKRTWKGI